MQYAFVFPGQGSQKSGMALDLAAKSPAVRSLFALAAEVLGTDPEKYLSQDDQALKRTETAQPALTLVGLAVRAYLGEQGIKPAASAGHSLGEYPALAAAGVLSAEHCLRLVISRGKAMSRSAEGLGMAAVLGLPPERVEEAVFGIKDLFPANYNSPRQTVVSGTTEALLEAETKCKEAGARRIVRLAVSSAFHSPFMEDPAKEFAAAIEGALWQDPQIPFYSNVTGERVLSGKEAKTLALKQVTSPVKWTKIEANLAEFLPKENSALLECGPGTVLSGLWRDFGSEIPCFPCGTASDFEKIAESSGKNP